MAKELSPRSIQKRLWEIGAINSWPLNNTIEASQKNHVMGVCSLGTLDNFTRSTSPAFASDTAKTCLNEDIIMAILNLLHYKGEEAVRRHAAGVISNISKYEETHQLMRKQGALTSLVRLLEKLTRDKHEPATVEEKTCKSVLDALRSLLRDNAGLEEIKNTDLARVLIIALRDGTYAEKCFACSLMANIAKICCALHDEYFVYQVCSMGVFTYVEALLSDTDRELGLLCAMAVVTMFSMCQSCPRFFIRHRTILTTVINMFKNLNLKTNRRSLEAHVRSNVLTTLTNLTTFDMLHDIMVEEGVVDEALMRVGEMDGNYRQLDDLGKIILRTSKAHPKEMAIDVVESFMILFREEEFFHSWSACHFLAYILDLVKKYYDLIDILLELGGLNLLIAVGKNQDLPILVRENSLQILLLAIENYDNIGKLLSEKVVSLCCECLRPSADGTLALKETCILLLKIFRIYSDEQVFPYIESKYSYLKAFLSQTTPEQAPLIMTVKVERRKVILETTPIPQEIGFSPVEIAKIKQSFIKYDADASATIDIEELKNVFKDLGINLNMFQLRAVIAAAGNGENPALDWLEFVELMADYKQGKITGLGYIRDILKKMAEEAANNVTQLITKTTRLGKDSTRRRKSEEEEGDEDEEEDDASDDWGEEQNSPSRNWA